MFIGEKGPHSEAGSLVGSLLRQVFPGAGEREGCGRLHSRGSIWEHLGWHWAPEVDVGRYAFCSAPQSPSLQE